MEVCSGEGWRANWVGDLKIIGMRNLLLVFVFTLVSSIAFAQQDGEMKFLEMDKADSIEIDKTFKKFIGAIENKDAETIKRISLSEIDCDLCSDRKYPKKDYYIPIKKFIKQAFKTYVDSPLAQAVKTRGYRSIVRFIPNSKPQILPSNFGNDLTIYELYVQTYKPNEWMLGHEGQSHAFQFVKVNGEFKFYGMTSIP